MVYIFVEHGWLGWQAKAYREKEDRIYGLSELLEKASVDELSEINCQINHDLESELMPVAFEFSLRTEKHLKQIQNISLSAFAGMATYLALALSGNPAAGTLAGMLAPFAVFGRLDKAYAHFKGKIDSLRSKKIFFYTAPTATQLPA